MAPPPGTMRVSRYFIALGLVLGLLYLIVFLPGTANTPKLGIDLVGGIRVIFTAQPPAGQEVTSTSMEQARQIIEDRINGTGVTASTVQIQGDDQLVVSIPGGTDTDVARLGQAAQLNFRPVIAPAVPVTCNPRKAPVNGSTVSPSASASGSAGKSGAASTAPRSTGSSASTAPANASAGASGSASGNAQNERPLTAPTPATTTASRPASTPASGSATTQTAPSGSGTATSPAASPSATQAAPACYSNIATLLTKSDPTLKLPTTEAAYTALTQTQKQTIAAGLANFDCGSAGQQADNAKSYYIACDSEGGQSVAYLLGTVIVRGTQIDEANAIAPSTGGQGGGSTEWTVSLTLDDSGQKAWGDWTTAHNTGSQQGTGATQCGSATGGQPCSDYVAFTLDGAVVSAPATNEPIVGQATQISGSFTQKSASTLADQLKFGALPLSFRTDSNERVSASLGTSQLKAAFLAGGIGLVLVVIYSLLYYRGLGLVTIASLIVSGLLTYAMMVILGQQIGFTLDLAGIAGLIVALGITADSFVVFFERIKDEVHEGRSVRVAVPRGWVRARRTVISADVVSFLAAVILYVFASADVKGFAFTLGLSTVLDLFVVVVFTHPIVSLLSRSRAFGSPRFTGLNSVRAGGITPDRDEPRVKRSAASRRGDAAERAASRRGRPVRQTAVLEKADREDEFDDLESTELDDGSDLNFTEADDPDELGTDETDADAADEAAADEPEADEAPADSVDTVDTVDTVDDEPETPRKRTSPSGGTAAERAAARRARLRQQRDEEGE